MPKITQKGQITIPQAIRDKFSFLPGTDVQFVVAGNEVIIRKSRDQNKFLKWLGSGKRTNKQRINLMVDQGDSFNERKSVA